jgi:uncharacterized protein YukE
MTLLNAGGGSAGSIVVDPAVLDSISGTLGKVATGTQQTLGSVATAASAAAGCEQPAAGEFDQLQAALSKAMVLLQEGSSALAGAVTSASSAYTDTDANVCPAP